jgi:flagellar biosynthesis protein FlhG
MRAESNLENMRKDYIACAYLFSPKYAKVKGFVETLEINTLKKAFRKKAKQYHPDLNQTDSQDIICKRQERFIKIKNAYEHLFQKLQQQNPHMRVSSGNSKLKKPKIIAVGGAKGGIGKSIFASNLSVYLSQKGFRTVAVDLDLGGANIHLFLGKPFIKHNINEFLANKVKDINTIMEKSKYGPFFIGGNSSKLGAANISFTQKLKLLRAIRNIKADYVILNLGGDTSYNVIDFFLAADLGLVMTTCDPASYLDAYSFIKVALYRKLNRLHGPESIGLGKRPIDPILKRLIQETTMSTTNPLVGDIEELISRVRREHPKALYLIKKVLLDFDPQLIVNKITDEAEAIAPVNRIQEVSRKKLSIQIGYLCAMPYQFSIEKSARTLVPWISNDPDIVSVKKIDTIADRLYTTPYREH